MNNILIYDSGAFGHTAEFIEYFMDYLTENETFDYLVFLIHKKNIVELQNSIYKAQLKNSKFKVLLIDDNWQKKIDSESNIYKRTLLEKKLLEQYCESINLKEILFLHIDSYQYIIGKWSFSKFRYLKISGILFSPYNQFPKSKYKILRIRKKLQLTWMFLNRGVRTIFILNDEDGISELNKTFRFTPKFSYLPDPIKIRDYDFIDVRKLYDIPADNLIGISIGGIEVRKNISSIIKASSILEEKYKKKFTLLILGKCHDKVLLREILDLKNKHSDFQIIFEDIYLSREYFESFLSASDLVFIIYSNFYQSSGIFGNAAKYKKFIISSKYGLISHLVKKYNVGYCVDPSSLTEISNSIEHFICERKSGYQVNYSNFISEHDSNIFVQNLLKQNI